MEKEISLVMKDDKNIEICVNGILKQTITESQRKISAQDIYDIIDFKIGERLNVNTINENNIDANVLAFFKDLFSDICDSINVMDFSENNPDEFIKEVAKEPGLSS